MTKSTLLKKKIGDKIYKEMSQTQNRKFVTDSSYTTNGESLIIVKNTPKCVLTLDHTNTQSIKIKAMTKVTIKIKNSLVDEYYEELEIEKGACVELEYFETSWYILSSDGLKLN